MIIGAPWGLLGLLALPLILAIHCFRRSHRPVAVSALWLYGPARQAPSSGRRRDRLLRRPSLWWELAAALAATLSLADLHFSPRSGARHLILVLDDRWRMQAVDERDGSSAAQRLRQELSALLAELDGDDRVSVIATGSPPRVLAGPAARVDRALLALQGWQPQAPGHSLQPALELAAELAGGDGGSILLGSDQRPERLPRGVGHLAVGRAVPSIGLVDARWLRRAADGERLVLRVRNGGPAPGRRRLRIVDAAGSVVHERELALEPGAQELVTVALDGRHPSLHARLEGPDGLAIDDRLELLRPEARRLGAWIGWPEPAAAPLRRALQAAGVELVDGDSDPALAAVAGVGEGHSGTWQLALRPGDGAAVIGPYLARQGDPLLRDCDFTACVWAGGAELAAFPAAEVLLAAGDRALITARRRGRDRDIALHLDLERSTLDRHPAWPALIANLVADRRAALPGPLRSNLPVGQAQHLMLPADAEGVLLIDPDGETQRVHADIDGAITLPGFRRVGRYRFVLLTGTGERPWCEQSALPCDGDLVVTSVCASSDEPPAAAGVAVVDRFRGPLEHLLPLVLLAVAALLAWRAWRREEGLAGAEAAP